MGAATRRCSAEASDAVGAFEILVVGVAALEMALAGEPGAAVEAAAEGDDVAPGEPLRARAGARAGFPVLSKDISKTPRGRTNSDMYTYLDQGISH